MLPESTRHIRVKPYFKWFDLWVGIYWDKANRIAYIGLLPMFGVKVWNDVT